MNIPRFSLAQPGGAGQDLRDTRILHVMRGDVDNNGNDQPTNDGGYFKVMKKKR